MSSLVKRVQRGILGSAGPEKVRSLLEELQIEYGREPTDDCVEQVRRVVLYSGATVEQMREAFSNVGANPDDESALRQTISDLLAVDGGEAALREWLAAQEGGESPTA